MKKLKNILSIVTLALILGVSLNACKKEDPKTDLPKVDERELITTVKVVLTDSSTGFTQMYSFKDLDGEGGNAPSIDSIILSKNKTYTCEILLLDETKSPIDTISNEVLEESNDHLFTFKFSDSELVVAITDTDSKGLPLGLMSRWRTFKATEGYLTIRLLHQAGTKDGTDKNGETDIEVNYPVKIE